MLHAEPALKTGENVFLVGLMGAGKTTVGRRLASELKLRFVDSDHEIEQRTGVNIPLIFELEGEAGFRARERAVIEDLTKQSGLLLATGGGAVLDPDNRAKLMSRGRVIYLHAPVDRLLARTSRDRNRPLLQTENRQAKLEQLYRERDPIYRQIADVVVSTDHHSIHTTVHNVLLHFSA